MMPGQIKRGGEPLSDQDLTVMLIAFSVPGQFTAIVTEGDMRVGTGIVHVADVPPGQELFSLHATTLTLEQGQHTHALIGGDLVTMDVN